MNDILERNRKYIRAELIHLACTFMGITSLIVLLISIIAYGVIWPTIVLSWIAVAFFIAAKYYNNKALKYLLWEA